MCQNACTNYLQVHVKHTSVCQNDMVYLGCTVQHPSRQSWGSCVGMTAPWSSERADRSALARRFWGIWHGCREGSPDSACYVKQVYI